MLFQGVLITNLSGKLDGSVWSHNRGGPYVRSNATPTGGPTPEQTLIRATMGTIVYYWRNILTAAERELWRLFSQGNPRPNRIGELRPIGALPEFVRANLIRVYADSWLETDNFPLVSVPPPDGHSATPMSPPSVAAIAATNTDADVTYSEDDPWNDQTGSGILVFVAPAQAQTINWFRGPWTLTGAALPASSSPITVDLEAAATSGTRQFFKFRATDQWGQLSPPTYTFVDVP